jgi:hypothetical protein
MLTLEQIKEALRDRRPSMVAEATGLHFNTVRDVRDNPNANPTYKVLKALSDYLMQSQERAVSNG